MKYQPQQIQIRDGASALPTNRKTSTHREMERRAARLEATVGTDRHYDEGFAVRESDMNANAELVDMMEYTLRPHAGRVPGVETVLGHGAKLVEKTQEGEALRALYNPRTLFGGVSGRMVIGWILEVEGTPFILSLYSAAKTNEQETNDYTDALAAFLKRHTVGALYTGPFSRLVRSKEHAMDLKDAGRKAGTTIHAYGRYPADLTTESGREIFDRMVDEAVWDYNLTVERLTRGSHALLMEGQYPKSEDALPALGYTFKETAPGARKVDRTPIPDLTKLDLVRDLLTWGASDLTDLQIAERLASKHGWGSGALRAKLDDPTATVMDARYPATAVRQLWKHIDLFETGKYIYEARIPVSEEKVRADVAEHAVKIGMEAIVSVELDFHHEMLPDGRWVDPAVIRLCREKRERLEKAAPQGRAASADGERKPLAGLAEWIDGKTQYKLSARHSSFYLLTARDASLSTTKRDKRAGWTEDGHEVVAKISPADLHQTLGEAIVDNLDSLGVEYNRTITTHTVVGSDPTEIIAAAEHQLALARRKAKRAAVEYAAAVENYEEHETEANYATMREALAAKAEAEQTVRDAEKRLADVDAAAQSDDPITVEVEVEVDDLSRALAALIQTEDRAPAGLNLALRNCLVNLRLTPTEDGTEVDVSCCVRVGTDEGPIEVGPIVCRVKNRQRVAHKTRRTNLLALMLRDGKSIEEAAHAGGYSDTRIARRRVLAELESTGLITSKGLRSAILDCPIIDARRVVWAEIEAKRTGTPFQLPKGVNRAYASHIRATYIDNEQNWLTAWCSDSHQASRTAIAAVETAGKKGMRWDDLVEQVAPGIGAFDLRTLTVELVNGKGTHGTGARIQYEPVLERSDPWHRHADRRVWARRCPYCETRTLTHVLRVPEVPGGLLCTKCAHAPSMPEVKFPADYLRRWAGPRGFGKGRGKQLSGTVEDV